MQTLAKEQVEKLTDVDRVLLPFGYCGTTVGLHAGNFEMILPKPDDCITLFLGSRENRKAVPDERNILKEYDRLCEKYNQRRADRVMRAMYQHYHAIALVDSGLFPLEQQTEVSEKIAELLHLEHKVLPGTGILLQKQLCGPYDDGRLLRGMQLECLTILLYIFGWSI